MMSPKADQYHRVEVEFEPGYGPTVRFACTAPEGTSCRMVPVCVQVGDCEEYHREDCQEKENLVDAGECNVALWFDNGDTAELGEGKASFPVATEWTGDDFNFILAGPGDVA